MILYNKIQTECIEHPPSPLMIIAGAGTGKTTTIVGRIAHLIKTHNIDPKSILAMTYTVKAAEHLKSEISNVVGSDYDSINALNFHSFALNQVQSFYEFLGYRKSPTLIESNESKYLIRKLILDNANNFTSSEFRKNSNSAFFFTKFISLDFLLLLGVTNLTFAPLNSEIQSLYFSYFLRILF